MDYNKIKSEIVKSFESNGFNLDLAIHADVKRRLADLYDAVNSLELRDDLLNMGFDINKKQIPNINSYSIFYCNSNVHITRWTEFSKISMPDDSEPEDGDILLIIEFPTGAHILLDKDNVKDRLAEYNYAKSFFDKMFEEFKSYQPDYSDSTNHKLLWDIHNPLASYVFNEFSRILEKYQKQYLDSRLADKEQRIRELEEQINILKNS